MDLHLGGKTAVVTGASKGLAWRSPGRWSTKARRWLPEPAGPA